MNPNVRAYWVQRVFDVWALHGHRWVQGSYSITRGGLAVSWAHTAARGFCLAAAIEYVTAEHPEIRKHLYDAFIEALHLDPHDGFAIEHWNDAPQRVFADVRRACERAAFPTTISTFPRHGSTVAP